VIVKDLSQPEQLYVPAYALVLFAMKWHLSLSVNTIVYRASSHVHEATYLYRGH
jgi:hypothetical protein